MTSQSDISVSRLSLSCISGRRWALTLALGAMVAGGVSRASGQSTLPDRLADSTFWRLVTDFSEPAGYFRSENFTSNETGFQRVIPELLRTTKPGGVYLGVGPEQNFTYIIALKPKLAFITDIRRQNMLQHLVYKSLMEMYDNRADFLSHLFSIPRPAGLDTSSTATQLFAAYSGTIGDATQYKQNLTAILDQLRKKHGFVLSDSDVALIGHVVTVFYQFGPNINYSSVENGGGGGGGGLRGGGMANYTTLMQQTDATGLNRAYLATEANYRQLRDMEMRNAIVPVVGNFGGPKALRAVGAYLKEHQATVTAMYCSNVEQYLFMDNIWGSFINNIATLPLDSVSTFIRTGSAGGRGGFGGGGGGGGRGGGGAGNGMNNSLLASMQATVAAYKAGQINVYADVLNMSHPSN